MIDLRLTVPAILTAAAMAGCFTRLVGYISERNAEDAKREMTEHLQRLRRHLMRAERLAADHKVERALADETPS